MKESKDKVEVVDLQEPEKKQIITDNNEPEIKKTKMQKQLEIKEKVKEGVKSNKLIIVLLVLIAAFIIFLPILYSILTTR